MGQFKFAILGLMLAGPFIAEWVGLTGDKGAKPTRQLTEHELLTLMPSCLYHHRATLMGLRETAYPGPQTIEVLTQRMTSPVVDTEYQFVQKECCVSAQIGPHPIDAATCKAAVLAQYKEWYGQQFQRSYPGQPLP